MMEYKGEDYRGLGWFGQYVIHLVDSGYHESIETIQQQIRNCNIATYLLEKYKTSFPIKPCNIDAINAFFEKFENYATSRKLGIYEEDNGLLLVPSLILSESESQLANWI